MLHSARDGWNNEETGEAPTSTVPLAALHPGLLIALLYPGPGHTSFSLNLELHFEKFYVALVVMSVSKNLQIANVKVNPTEVKGS